MFVLCAGKIHYIVMFAEQNLHNIDKEYAEKLSFRFYSKEIFQVGVIIVISGKWT